MNPAISEHEAAGLAAEMFDHFCAATTMRQILGLYRNMCDILQLRPGPLNEFYPKFKSKIRNWKAQALWKKFDARASHRAYNKGTAASGTRVLVIGAGPCGLRTAIEAQLLGAKVVVVEKRDRISRNNVLHLWPFLITDLKALGAKKFYGKFCAGSIDHISIRQLQCILLKVALILGVEVHEGVSFTRELEPKDGCGWRAAVSPEDHAVSHYEFDVLIGADGKRNTLEGFKRKEFRGKLAIAITANFINKKTEAEAKVEEISGVAFIFNQSFFKELYQTTGIDLENIVYYKDETHYFVMTAKKHSLLDKGVIMQDYADPAELLSSANVDTTKLLDYAKEAANFSTKYQMPNLEFAVNHYGKPDVAMFDFTSMFAADNSCKITVRKNYRLLSCLVGDSLLEPFWPTGSGCARGFLSSMDAAYAIKLFSNPKNSLLAVLATRESIYRLLAQTTPENLHRDIGAYTVDPSTRYPNLNKASVNMIQVKHLLDTDDPALLEQTFLDSNALTTGPEVTVTKQRKRRTNDTVPLGIVLLRWVKSQLKENQFVQELSDASQCFTNGRVLCTLINRYRPDLVNLEELQGCSADECNEFAFAILEDHLGIPRVMSGQDSLSLTSVDSKQWLNYLEQICEVFRGEIPHVKHPKLDYAEFKQKQQIDSMEEFAKLRRFAVNRMQANAAAAGGGGTTQPAIMAAASATGIRKTSIYNEEERAKRSRKVLGAESSPIASPQTDTTKRAKKRRSYEKFGNIEERTRRLQEIESNRADRQTKRRQARAQQTQNFFTSLHMLQANTLLRESDDSSGAFEDYSLFLYRQQAPVFNDRVKEIEMKLRYPDRERGLAAAYPRGLVGADGEQFSDRIRSMEQRIGGGRHAPATEKKPKDLLRAIGKIDSNDWNVKEIEKKIELSKKATDIGKSRERVPKWNREQFLARQNKLTQQPDGEEKYKEFDSSIKAIDKQLKEGHNLDLGERGKNKVASIAGQLQSSKQHHHQHQQQNQKSTSKAALVLTSSGVAEKCHFCKQRVYLMEKISAENLTLHRSCLKCHHCHTNLRLGGYAFDRDDPEGKFYCTQHFKLPSKTVKPVPKRSLPRTPQQIAAQSPIAAASAATAASAQQPSTPDSKSSGINFDLLDRGETPERIEFENADEAISDGEAAMEVIDENEWTDRNFGTESDESDEEMSSSDESDSDSDSDYEEAAGSPLGAQTLQLASEWISDKRFSNMVDSDDDFYGYSSEDDEADSQTEGEELARAREMRMQEVKLMPPPTLPTDTETEGGSDSDSNSEEVNSATEISTDSEFDQEPSHHRLPPRIFIDDTHLRRPAKVQVKQMTIDNGVRQRRQFSATTNVRNLADSKQRSPGDDDPYYKRDIHLEFKPLIEVDPTIKLSQNRAPLSIPRPGDYALSKTASTEGIASKKSLELKKKYLLGESTAGTGVLKSGSASALDSKFKSFHSNITECQKLLNPAPEISPTMQTFLQKTSAPAPTATSLLALRKEAMLTGRNEEKENVYDGKIAPKRYAETVNATLVENKLNELKKEEAKDKKDDRPNNNNERLIETISLITPEKESRRVEEEPTEQKPIVEDGDRIVEIKNISNLKHMFIDLTSDSPNCDRSLVETTLNFSMTPPSAAKGTSVQSNGELKNNIPDIISSIKIDSNENKVEEEEEQERTRSPAHETSIQVPEVPWNKEQEDEEDIDSDSISESSSSSSSSSTSSVDDIPHFILDSTTSPETQNDERFVPRVEVRDTAGELMQIDSLMIIDGKYIGDPEDLKLLEELPPDTKIAAKLSQQEMNLDSICVLEDKLPTPTEERMPPPIPLPVLELEPKEDPVEKPASKPSSPTQPKPDLKFDTRNENKLDTLKNLPLVLDLQPQKPRNLSFAANRKSPETDAEKTPLAPSQLLPQLAKAEGSDSETELTAQNLTETELSDWAADDAVSENFVDIEFALSSNKGTIRRNKPKHGRLQQKKVIAAAPLASVEVRQQASEDGIMKNLAIEDIEFMDTGSEEESCIESYSATNRAMLKNRGYVEFVDPRSPKPATYAMGNNYGQLAQSSKPKLVEAINKQVAGVDYIEQGAYLLNSAAADDSKTPMNEEPPAKITFSALAAQNKALQQQPPPQQLDSLNDIEEDSLLIVTSSQGTATTTEESEAPTIVAPVERTVGSGSSGRGSVSSFSSKQMEGDKSGGSPVRKVSTESSSGGKRSSLERNMRKDSLKNNIDDIGYDEYVKRLQQKIALISSARDSLEVKKSKRKSSKGDAGLDEASVVEPVKKPAVASIYTEQSSLEVPKSVEKKIEEITKERVKQKDIIHDLVMDKLQTKKQLNAEKRLNRSRNRNNVLPGVSPVTPSHPTPAHPPEGFPPYQPVASDRRNRILDSKETTFAQPTPVPIFPNKENIASFATPASYLQATPRTNAKKPAEETLTLTEQLREEARARARLKSNQDLGLSPEDRVQLLRKKFHINLRELNDQDPNKCDDTKFKERSTKLMTSKSVNDVSILKNLSNDPDFISPVDEPLIGAKLQDYVSDPNLVQSPTTGSSGGASDELRLRTRSKCKDRERRKSIIEKVSEFFNSRKKTEAQTATGASSGSKDSSPTKKEAGCGSGNELAVPNSASSSTSGGGGVGFLRFKISPKLKDKSKSCFDVRNMGFGTKEGTPYERCASEDCLKNAAATTSLTNTTTTTAAGTTTTTSGRDTTTTGSSPTTGGGSSSGNRFTPIGRKEAEELEPPPIPPLPLNYQRSDDESCTTNEPKNELKKLRAMSKASRQAELKRLRIAQEIQREQEEIEVKIKDLETRGVEIEKELRGESESLEKNIENLGANDEGLVKEWLELMRSITRHKVRDEELTIRQQELQLEHRHAQLKEELNMRLSCSKLDKNSSDVAAEGAILNEMLEIVAKRQALRPSLDAAAAAAAASVGVAAAALPPRSKDVSDVSTDEQELEEELEELEDAGIERDCVAVASTSSGRNSSSNHLNPNNVI